MPPKDDTRQPCIRCPEFVNPEDPKGRNYHATFEECQREFPGTGPGAIPVSGLWWGFTSNEALSTKADLKNVDVCKQLLRQAQNLPISQLSRHMSKEDFEKYERESTSEKRSARFSKTLITKENLERAVKVAYPVKQTGGTSARSTVATTAVAAVAEGSMAGEPIPGPSVERTTNDMGRLGLGDTASDTTTAGITATTTTTTTGGWATVPTKSASTFSPPPATTPTTSSKPPVLLSPPFTPPTVQYNDPPQLNRKAIDAKNRDAEAAVEIHGEVASFNTATALNAVNRYAAALARDRLRFKGEDETDEHALKQEIEVVKNSYGLRKGFAKGNGKASRVVANYVRLTPPKELFVYQVYMKRMQKKPKDKERKPVKITKFSEKKSLLQSVEAIVPQLQPRNGIKHWVTDGDLIWSTEDLFPPHRAPGAIVLSLSAATPPNLGYRLQCGDLAQADSVEIKFKEHIAKPDDVLQLCTIDSSRDYRQSTLSILVRGLNAFLTDSARNNNTLVFTSGQKGFDSTSNVRLDEKARHDPLRCLKGFSLSSRPGSDKILLNINTAFSAFFNVNQTVQDFLKYHFYSIRNHAQKTALLRGLQVVLHNSVRPRTGNTRYWFIYGIADDNSEIPNIQVAKEMREESYDATGEAFPATKLIIESWQPFPAALTAIQTDTMIKIARMFPHQNHRSITRTGLGLFNLHVAGQPTALKIPFGMSVGTDMLEVPAYRLPPVMIQYRNASKLPEEAMWNLSGGPKFAESGSQLVDLPYLDLCGLSRDSLHGVFRTLKQKLQTHNVLPHSATSVSFRTSSDPDFDVSLIAQLHHGHEYDCDIQYVLSYFNQDDHPPEAPILVILKQKDYDMYSYVKRIAELWLGQRTICVTSTKLARGLNPQTASNIALKYNIKIGGTTHTLQNSFQPLRTPTRETDTIVIGADVTHPGPGAYNGTPSIAAVVGSVDDHFMQFPGSMRLQRSRKEFIIELGDMVKERLIDWAEEHNWNLPKRMLFYRDGVSESQYDKIRTFEIPQIQQAYNWAREYIRFRARSDFEEDDEIHDGNTDKKGWPVPSSKDEAGNDLFRDDTKPADNFQFLLTYVVVGKRHNTRFYPIGDENMISTTEGRDGSFNLNGNIKPGFVIDQVITHPYSFDFYLQSHKPLAGTGKSAHYFVLQNSMELDTDTLQNVTHAFCYAYSRSTTGVSYCAPAYYADRLCDRGRAYLRHWLTKICEDGEEDDDNNPGYKPRRRFNRADGDTFESYGDEMKDRMRNSDYWRPEIKKRPLKYGHKRRNPWHPSLDKIMFYL